jgi:hypothetical protein
MQPTPNETESQVPERNSSEPYYRAFLLRFHRGSQQKPWRTTLKNVHTGEVLRFPSQQKLLLYLIQVLEDDESLNEADEPPATPAA